MSGVGGHNRVFDSDGKYRCDYFRISIKREHDVHCIYFDRENDASTPDTIVIPANTQPDPTRVYWLFIPSNFNSIMN